MWTYDSLRKHGYTGKIYLVADDLDKTVDGYKKKYGDELLIFDKKKAALNMDTGDNSGDFRSTLFSANTIFELAKERDIKYFFIMCDDYSAFHYRTDEGNKLAATCVKRLDDVFKSMVKFYKNTPTVCLAMAQGGDFIGGRENDMVGKLKRKAMNTLLCSTDRPFKFIGRLNEDVTTYVNLGGKGLLFYTVGSVSIVQNPHQGEKGGLTDVYLDAGTYVKSFFSVMYNPSCVKVKEMGSSHKRIHHVVKWNNAVPKIISENYYENMVEDDSWEVGI